MKIILALMDGGLTEWELWAEVRRIHRQHGEKVLYFIADQIGGCLLANDMRGVHHWREIEDRLRELRRGGSLH
jgi:hypothetical protein